MRNTVQLGEYSKGGGIEDISHNTDSNGNPNVFNVKRNDDGKPWLNANWANPDDHWNLDNGIVFRLRNSLHFSSRTEEFCFTSCPCQPPSILPISFSCTERARYFLSRSDFVSQRIIVISKRVLSFRIAMAT